jgi:hypothetical protein
VDELSEKGVFLRGATHYGKGVDSVLLAKNLLYLQVREQVLA